jgi:hypothetical protein
MIQLGHETLQRIVLLGEAKRSEKDLVLPKRNSGSETRVPSEISDMEVITL